MIESVSTKTGVLLNQTEVKLAYDICRYNVQGSTLKILSFLNRFPSSGSFILVKDFKFIAEIEDVDNTKHVIIFFCSHFLTPSNCIS